MKKKILTLMLSAVMVFSLAACGSKEEPVAETEASSEEETTEQVSEPSEPEIEEPEQVELTADTIDKYFGFEYTDVADDSVTGFELTVTESYGTATVKAPSVPVRYSDTATSTTELAQTIQNWATDDFDANHGMDDSRMPMFNPFTLLSTTYNIKHPEAASSELVSTDDGRNRHRHTAEGNLQLTEEAMGWIEVDSTASWCDNMETGAGSYYAIMLPNDTFNVIDSETRGVTLTVSNDTENFAIVDNCNITYLNMPFTSNFASVTVAGDINADSAIEDVVAKHAPTSGTIDENNGNIILTWTTTSGTIMDITFDANTHKEKNKKTMSSTITDEILSKLNN